MTSPELSELDYFREIERLANRVSVEASNEGWLSFQIDPEEATPLQRSVNSLLGLCATTTSRAMAAWRRTGLWSASSEPRC
ncbi:hypothetical protein ACFVY1_40075 [Streptomyces sp. NPDC058293]|uniref:hypothetical protein n=1 Tax=Streptomyces sp. NPDC058293 TaxID=3346429 RepID=UPI0036EB35CF